MTSSVSMPAAARRLSCALKRAFGGGELSGLFVWHILGGEHAMARPNLCVVLPSSTLEVSCAIEIFTRYDLAVNMTLAWRSKDWSMAARSFHCIISLQI